MNNKDQKAIKNSLKQSTYYVQGMHCASCEVLIEKTLIEKKGVKSVDVSLKDRHINIWHDKSVQFSVASLNSEFKELGYIFSKNEQEKRSQWDMRTILVGGGIFLALILLFNVFDIAQLGRYMSVDATSSLIAFLILGLVAGLSSCAALVGGILLSMSKRWNEQYIMGSTMDKAQPHILFHSGRIIAYVILGGVLGSLGNILTFGNITVYAVLILVISVVMIILGLQMIGVSWAQKLRLALPRSVARFVSDDSHFSGSYMPFALGAGTFFLPCGFTLVAQGVALVSGSFLAGSLIMGLFALGTLPTLCVFSCSGLLFTKRPHWTARFNIVAGVLVLFFGLYNINAQLNVLGLSSLSSAAQVRSEQNFDGQAQQGLQDGKQVIRVIARDFEYVPLGSMTLKADVPTTLLVENQGIVGCGQFMMARGLIDGWVKLSLGSNAIEFTPKKGMYKLTCTMGMVPPVTITVE